MPGLLASTHKSDTGWIFSLRDKGTYDTDSDSDFNEDETIVAAKKRTAHAQLLKEIDLSAREDTAVYKPNPWTIAQQNSACRSSSCASFVTPINTSTKSRILPTTPTNAATANRSSSSASFINKSCSKVSRKSVQTTLDKLLTIEKTGTSTKPTLSKATQSRLPFKYDSPSAFTSVTRINDTKGQSATAVFNKPALDTNGGDSDKIKATLSSAMSSLPEVYHNALSGLPTPPKVQGEISNPPSSVNSIFPVPNKQENQDLPYMHSDFLDDSWEYSVETNDHLEDDRTELLRTNNLDIATASDWARTLEHTHEELLRPSSNASELVYTQGYETIQDYSNSSRHNPNDANLPPSFSPIERRPDIKTLPLLGTSPTYFNSSARRTRETDDEDPDLTWSTLPSRHRKKSVKTKTHFKNSGKFKLPSLPERIAIDTTIADSTTEKLPNGKRLTFYKPPTREQFDSDDKPVILRVRKGNRQDWEKVTKRA